MTMSVLEVEMRADALVRLMRSDGPLDRAPDVLTVGSDEDVEAILSAFRWQGWGKDNVAVPDRGHRILNLIAELPEGA